MHILIYRDFVRTWLLFACTVIHTIQNLNVLTKQAADLQVCNLMDILQQLYIYIF